MAAKKRQRVTARYFDEAGALLWEDNPYIYRSMFARGQMVSEGPPYLGKPEWEVVSNKFDGVFGNGVITYVVRKPRFTRGRANS